MTIETEEAHNPRRRSCYSEEGREMVKDPENQKTPKRVEKEKDIIKKG
jgi:hypothetical protein